MKYVILYDPHTTGHHLSYLRLYATVFHELGCKTAVLTSDVCRVEDYFYADDKLERGVVEVGQAGVWGNRLLEEAAGRRRGFLREVADSYFAFKRLRQANKDIKRFRRNKNTLVVFLWFDDYIARYLYATLVDWFVDFNFVGLWFHPNCIRYANDERRRLIDLKHDVPLFTSPWIKHIGLFDISAVEKLQAQYQRDIFSKLPDIAEVAPPDLENPLIVDILARARGRKIVSLVGSLDRRKNLPCFFRAAINGDDDIFFVCAGFLHKSTFAEGEVEFLFDTADKYRDKIFFYDKHIKSDRVFNSLIFISSVIVAVYSNFPSSSNIVAKSANYGRPVVVAGEFLMGSLVRDYGIGLCIKPEDVEELSAAIRNITKNEGEFCGDFARFARDHSRDQLKECLSRFVC